MNKDSPTGPIKTSELKPTEERRLAGILAADVVGFSAMMGIDETGTFLRIKRLFNEIIKPHVEQNNGRVFKTLGDGFLAEFSSVVNAVRCAIAIQKAMELWSSEDGPGQGMQLRIGVNLGDIIVDGDDVYGSGVNIAARVESIAEPGGISVTANVYDQIKSVTGANYEDIGEQSLKNIADPVRIYNVRTGDHSGLFPVASEKRALPTTKLAGIGALILLVVGLGAWLWSDLLVKTEPGNTGSGRLAVAVRSFEAVSDDKQDRLFSEGLTEDIVTALSRVSQLHVADRAITRKSEGGNQSAKDLAKALGVSHVLEGSVASDGKKLRINVRLVDTKSSTNVWAQRFDRDATKLFDLRDEITLDIVNALNIKLVDGQVSGLRRRATSSLEAWLLHREALEHAFKFTRPENAIAKELLEKALEIDPKFVTAHVDLGWRHWSDASNQWSPSTPISLSKAEDLANKALEIDPQNASIYSLFAGIEQMKGNHEDGVTAARKAVDLAPRSAEIYASYAFNLIYAGYPERAIEAAIKSLELAPQSPAWYRLALAKGYQQTGQIDKAIEQHRKFLSQSSKGSWAGVTHLHLAIIFADQGDKDAAKAEIRLAKQANPQLTLKSYEAKSLEKDRAELARFISKLKTLDEDKLLTQ